MVKNWILFCCKMPKRGKVVPAMTQEVYTINALETSGSATPAHPAPSATPAPEMQARRNLLWHLLLDLPILLLVGAVCILLEVGALPSRRAGFTCNDPALSYPHMGETLSIPLLAVVTLVLPFLIMWSVEAMLYREDEYSIKKSRWRASALTAALIYREYIYGAVMNLAVMEVIKCLVGSPRPTFFDLCQPDKAKTCNGSEFVSSYECTSSRYSRYLVIDSSRSFPSAHTSLAVYTGVFTAWYLQRRAFSWHNRSVLVVPLAQMLCLVYAAAGSLTRVTDRRHHWWDVLFGAVMGMLTVLYTVLVLCKNFSQPAVVSTSDISSGNNHPSVRRLLSGGAHAVP